MADRLTALRYQSGLLGRWCNLPSRSDIDVNNTLEWTPCGAVQYVTMQMQNIILWHLKVNSEFVIDIYFHVFHIDAVGELCPNSALIVYGKSKSPIFCGKRKPWSELVDNHVAVVTARQIDVIKPMLLSFTYSVLDPIDWRRRVLQSRVNTIMMGDKPKQSLAYHNISKLLDLQIWYLEAPIGKVIVVTSSILNVLDHLSIFEGLGRYHPASNSLLRNKTAKLINYYAATIYFYNDMEMDSVNLHSLTFWHLNLTSQPLLPSSIRVHNDGGIYYKMFSIKTKPGSFPNVSFHIQRFDGWHDGGCAYGGFLFRQYLNDSQLEPQTLGPYCTDIKPNDPLTGTDGLDFLVFGDSGVNLIIYANGPLYTIDMKVVVSESSCVGIVSPNWLCSFLRNEIYARYVVKFSAYSIVLVCESEWIKEERLLHMTFVNISQCVIIQSIGYDSTETFIFRIIAHIHFRLTIKLKQNLLLPHEDNIYAIWDFIYKQDNGRVGIMSVNNTTFLSKQHVSYVSISTTGLFERMYYTYSFYVVPREGKFTCIDTQMHTHKIAEPGFELRGLIEVDHSCGAGVYKDKGTYILVFDVHSITPQILLLQVITSSCLHSNGTHDVLIACSDDTNCYAVDLLDKVFHLYSTLMKTLYLYERNMLCATFTIEYIFAQYNIIATMVPYDFQIIYVRMLTNHTQHSIFILFIY